MTDIRNSYTLRKHIKSGVPCVTEQQSGIGKSRGWIVILDGKIIRPAQKPDPKYKVDTAYATFEEAVKAAERQIGKTLPDWGRVSGRFQGDWYPKGTELPKGFRFQGYGRGCNVTLAIPVGRLHEFRPCARLVTDGSGVCSMHTKVQAKASAKMATWRAKLAADRERDERDEENRQAADEAVERIRPQLEAIGFAHPVLTVKRNGDIAVTPELLERLTEFAVRGWES